MWRVVEFTINTNNVINTVDYTKCFNIYQNNILYQLIFSNFFILTHIIKTLPVNFIT